MNSNNFPPGFDDDAKNLGVDFDGVIHNMNKGFYDGTCYGDPLPGALESLKQLSQKYTIIIYTAKAKSSRPLVEGKTGIELVWEWLKKYNVDQYVKEVTAEKPRAILYIDDNCYRHTNWKDTLNFINSYEN